MTTIEMIDRIANHFPANSAAWLQVMDLRARVESERAALQEAVEEIAILRDATRDDPDYQCALPSVVLDDALDIIDEKTGARHGE